MVDGINMAQLTSWWLSYNNKSNVKGYEEFHSLYSPIDDVYEWELYEMFDDMPRMLLNRIVHEYVNEEFRIYD